MNFFWKRAGFGRGTFSPTPSVCSGSLRISISRRRSPGDREKTSCSPSLGGFSPLQRGVLRSWGKVMGDPNRPLVDEVHRPEPLGNCRKSAAQFLGQLPSGHTWIREDKLMKSFLINRAGAAGGKMSSINWLSSSQLLVLFKKGRFTDAFLWV